VFDGVAQRGSRDARVVGFEKREKSCAVFTPGFAEDPADGFVHQVVFVGEQGFGDAKGVVEVAGADEGHGRDDGDAALPEIFGSAQLVENGARICFEVLAENGAARDVDEVPVVDAAGVAEIEDDDLLACLFIAALVLRYKDFKGGAAVFVEFRVEERFQIGQREGSVLERNFAESGNG